jgi:hypothetical protein
MAQRVYIHIGAPKTGTTFLQTAMWRNRSQLEAQGFLYPGKKRVDHYRASQVVRDVPASRLGDDADAWDRILAELSAWPGTGLISHEFFSMATTEQAQAAVAALAPAEVHVVLTARDYVRQFPAMYQEALKMNEDDSFDEFMKRAIAFELPGAWGWSTQDLPAVLETWAGAVPADRIHVITLPPPGAPRPLLWQRWCKVLGLDDTGFDMDLGVSNESMGAAQAALVRRMKPYLSNELKDDGASRHRWFRQYFAHEVLVPQRGERFGLRPDDAAVLRDVSTTAAEAIRRAGYDVTGDLAELVPPEAQPVHPHPDDVTEAELLDVACRAMEQMIRDVRLLNLEVRELASLARAQAQAAAATEPPAPRPGPRAAAGRLVRRAMNRWRR